MKTSVLCGWPARPAAHSVSEALTATGSPSGAWLTGKDLAGKSRRQPSTTGGETHTFAVAGISRTTALGMSGDMVCPAAADIADLSSMNTAPAVGQRSWPSFAPVRNTPGLPWELPVSAAELDNPVSPP